MNTDYTIQRLWVKSGIICNVEFTLTFTKNDMPGAKSIHSGRVSVSSFELAENAPEADIKAVLATLMNNIPGLFDFHEEQLAFIYDEQSSTVVDLAPAMPSPVSLVQIAGARLIVDQDAWEVTGVERSMGIAGAFLVDEDLVYVFFHDPQPDTLYDVIPYDGVTKYKEFVEVSRPNLAELNFIVQRVQ